MSADKPRGFAALSPEARRELARKGGRAAQATGMAHRFTPEEGKAAGRKGGERTRDRRRAADTLPVIEEEPVTGKTATVPEGGT
jgi:uncharacterized protein